MSSEKRSGITCNADDDNNKIHRAPHKGLMLWPAGHSICAMLGIFISFSNPHPAYQYSLNETGFADELSHVLVNQS